MAEFGCKFPDVAELWGLCLQDEVVCLGFVFDLLSVVLSLPPINYGLQQHGEGCDGRLVQETKMSRTTETCSIHCKFSELSVFFVE